MSEKEIKYHDSFFDKQRNADYVSTPSSIVLNDKDDVVAHKKKKMNPFIKKFIIVFCVLTFLVIILGILSLHDYAQMLEYFNG